MAREFVAITPGVVVAMKFDSVVGGDPGYDSAGGPFPYALRILRKTGDKKLNTEKISWERIGAAPPDTGRRKPKMRGSTGLSAFRKSISRALTEEQIKSVQAGEPV